MPLAADAYAVLVEVSSAGADETPVPWKIDETMRDAEPQLSSLERPPSWLLAFRRLMEQGERVGPFSLLIEALLVLRERF